MAFRPRQDGPFLCGFVPNRQALLLWQVDTGLDEIQLLEQCLLGRTYVAWGHAGLGARGLRCCADDQGEIGSDSLITGVLQFVRYRPDDNFGNDWFLKHPG